MFIDKSVVSIKGGDGGNGVVSFRHEKFVDRGGPDGGDGGKGGDVVVVGSWNENTLAQFRYQKLLEAENGASGDKRKKHGRSGKDLRINVPVGTMIFDESGQVIADITEDKQEEIIAKGGHGGFGNAHFVSSRRQAPKIAEKGEPGVKFEAIFELKMIAEVGLVGLPNAGKSTFLSRVTNAKPEIANYAFTTLRPNLGVADVDSKNSVLIADIPGLIEGASEGKGLGDEFLRHIERTKVLVHIIDAYQADITQAYKIIRNELKDYKVDLSKKPEIIAINKIDGLDQEMVDDLILQLKSCAKKTTKIFAISAQSGANIKDVMWELVAEVKKAKKKAAVADSKQKIPTIGLENVANEWTVEKNKNDFLVKGQKIERFASRTEFSSYEGVLRLRDIMRKMGIMQDLERRGIEPDQQIIIGDPERGRFDY